MFRRATHLIRNIAKNHRNLQYYTAITCSRIINTKIAPSVTTNITPIRLCSSTKPTEHVVDSVLDHATYERVCTETMDGLNDYFEELLESVDNIPGSDIAYSVSPVQDIPRYITKLIANLFFKRMEF